MFDLVIFSGKAGLWVVVKCLVCNKNVTTHTRRHGERLALQALTAPVDCHTCEHEHRR